MQYQADLPVSPFPVFDLVHLQNAICLHAEGVGVPSEVPGAVQDEADEAGGIDWNPPRLSEKSAFQRVICLLRYSGRGKSCRECSSVVYTAGACYLASQRSFFAMPCRRASSHGFVQFIEQGVDQTGIAVGEFLTLDVVISMTPSVGEPATDICRSGRPAR